MRDASAVSHAGGDRIESDLGGFRCSDAAPYKRPHYKEKASMRAIKLAAAFTAVAASFAPACATALAHGRHSHPQTTGAGGCQITLEVAPRPAYAGETVSAYGHLSAGCSSEEKQVVTLYRGDVGARP